MEVMVVLDKHNIVGSTTELDCACDGVLMAPRKLLKFELVQLFHDHETTARADRLRYRLFPR